MPGGLSRGGLWAAATAFVAAVVLFYAVGSRGESPAPAPKPRLGAPAELIEVSAPVTDQVELGEAADLPELAPPDSPVAAPAPEPKAKPKRKHEPRRKREREHAARDKEPKPAPAPEKPVRPRPHEEPARPRPPTE